MKNKFGFFGLGLTFILVFPAVSTAQEPEYTDPSATQGQSDTVMVPKDIPFDKAATYELCVGTKGYQKIGYCKYEYDTYLTRGGPGACKRRGGGWVSGASLSLEINRPGHLSHIRRGTTYVNFNDRTTGFCADACAGATATYNGIKFNTPGRCNKRSYE